MLSISILSSPSNTAAELLLVGAKTGELLTAGPLTAEPLTAEPLTAEPLKVANAELIIHWKSKFNAAERHKLRNWLVHAANTTSLIGGQFPRQQANINLYRYDNTRQAVPWAHTVRHTRVQGVTFYVNPAMALESFISDWTAVHEFSHLFIPYPGRDDLWISEGFASYYQNILMARAGTLSDTQAWQKLVDGFKRGSNDSNSDLTLTELSTQIRSRGGFMRVYWSGALYFLQAEILLQQNNQSLNAVVDQFSQCCQQEHKRWNGQKLALAFDKIANTQVFTPLFNRYGQQRKMPDYWPILADIGILPGKKGNAIQFSADSRLTQRRNKIIQGATIFEGTTTFEGATL
ncbi:MAG: hypothetical protein KUG79_07460 [Pseudomonadales bacterium]|nr:hypothetical protein [Pseudomonadales bacterium]